MRFGEALRMVQGQDWIIPRYRAYLQGRRDIDAEVKHAGDLLSKGQRDRTKSWAASGAGSCRRARQFSYLGKPGKDPDDHALNIFLNGTWTHLRHQVAGLAAGYLVAAEVPLTWDDYNMRGTMDGIDSTGTPVEYKSINSNGYMGVNSFGPKHEHLAQIHAYMLAGDFSSARLVYENKNTNDLKEFHVQRNPEIIHAVKSDVHSLEIETGQHRLFPMFDECKAKMGRYRYCPFAKICEGEGDSW